MESKQIILLGPPGAGVEQQAIALAERWHIPQVSMSGLVRAEILYELAFDKLRIE